MNSIVLMFRLSRRGALSLTFLALAVGSCQSDNFHFLVHVKGTPEDTQALKASLTLDGQPALDGQSDIPIDRDYFGVQLPSGSKGKLDVTVSALGVDQCKSGSGAITIDLSAGRSQEVTTTLNALTPHLCSLIYESSGEGEITVVPAGIPCGIGCQDYPAGASVTMSFAPSGRSFGAQVALDATTVCDGITPCTIPINHRVQAAAHFNPRLCTSAKWCWYNPLPQGSVISSLSGTDNTDIWAVGYSGTILHYDGKIWTSFLSPTRNDLYGVWSSSPNAAWAVGDTGTILSYGGGRWTTQPSGVTGNLRSVWGSSATDVWAVGNGGTATHYNGSTWSPVATETAQSLYHVSGSDTNNVWAVGTSNTALRFDGSRWNAMSPNTTMTNTIFNGVWSSSATDVWLVGTESTTCVNARINGTAWIKSNSCSGNVAVWGRSPMDIWAIGATINTLQHNTMGEVTQFLNQPVYGSNVYPGSVTLSSTTIWGTTPGEVWIGTYEGNVLRRNADSQTTLLAAPPTPLSQSGNFLAVSSTNANTYIIKDNGTLLRFDGNKLTTLPTAGGPSLAYDIWVAPSGEVFVGSFVGMGYVFKFAQGAWSRIPSGGLPSDVIAIGGTSATDFYIGTSGGRIMRTTDGSTFTNVNPAPYTSVVQSIWTRSPSESWATGDNGLIVRITNGVAVTQIAPVPASTNLLGVSGPPSPSVHVWAVGTNGAVVHYNGSTWVRETSGTTMDLHDVAALNDNDVWIVGVGGTLLHWNGTQLSAVNAGTVNTLNKIRGTTTDLWMVGTGGLLMRYRP